MQRAADDWLIGQLFRGSVPRPPIHDSALERIRDQPADFVALQGHEPFFGIIFVELRAKIHGVYARVIALHNEKVLGSKPDIVSLCNFSFLRRAGNTKSFRRGANNRTRLQQDDPISACDVMRVDRDEMTWQLSSNEAHRGPPASEEALYSNGPLRPVKARGSEQAPAACARIPLVRSGSLASEPLVVDPLIGAVLPDCDQGSVDLPAQQAAFRHGESGLPLVEFGADQLHQPLALMCRIVAKHGCGKQQCVYLSIEQGLEH